MFNSDKKRKQAAAQKEARQKAFADLQDRFVAVGNIQGAAEKFLALEELRSAVLLAQRDVDAYVNSFSSTRLWPPLTTATAAYAVGSGCIFVAGALPLLPVVIVGSVVAAVAGTALEERRSKRKKQQAAEEQGSLIASLQELSQKTADAIEVLLNSRLDEIASSPQAPQISGKYPAVRDRFAAAAISGGLPKKSSGGAPEKKLPPKGFNL